MSSKYISVEDENNTVVGMVDVKSSDVDVLEKKLIFRTNLFQRDDLLYKMVFEKGDRIDL